MSTSEEMALLEAFLFAAGDPIERSTLASLMQVEEARLNLLIDQLKRRYIIDKKSGLRLVEVKSKVALSTKVSLAKSLKRLFEPKYRQDLSQASYEVLAVIAYSEPVTRAEIEMVRGVNSDSVVSRLIERGLVEQRGTLDVPGRPGLLYVSEQFLLDFGLSSTKELEPVDLLMYDEEDYYADKKLRRELDNMKEHKDRKIINIAIDGPSAAGKGTLAKALASELDIPFLDTGAMYRALGLKAIKEGINPSDERAVEEMLDNTKLEVDLSEGEQKTFIDGSDYSADIRTQEVSKAASAISALPVCRQYCVERQREIAKNQSIILDGRDIGTYVLPHADIKFFISATAEIRAERRFKQLKEAQNIKNNENLQVTYEQILKDIKQRDYNDSHRSLAPTKKADDAIMIDTSQDSIAETVEKMMDVVNNRLGEQIYERKE